jgi:hypothetical protein
MTPPRRNDAVWSIDDLELELRKLPGVRAAGFEDLDDMLMVQLHVADRVERINRAERNDQPVPVSASRIAARHSDRPVTVEVVRWRTAPAAPLAPPEPEPVAPAAEIVLPQETAPTEIDATEPVETNRARLLAVLAFPDTDELEVHLVLEGKRTIGRAPASRGIDAAVEATIEAVRELGTGLVPRLRWANVVDDTDAHAEGLEVVAVGLDGVDTRAQIHYGMAAGTSVIDAAARATLDALNRQLSRED